MKALAVVIGIVFAAAVAVLAVAMAFPDRFGDYLPEVLQPSVEGDPQLVLGVESDGGDMGQAVTQSISVIERRLKDLGVRFKVQPQDNDRILVRIAPSVDSKRVIEVATRRGRLQFRLIETNIRGVMPEPARGEPPAHAEILLGRGDRKPYLVHKRAVLTGRDLVEVQAAVDQYTNLPVIALKFNANGARQFARVTQENVQKPFAIVLDNEVLSAPIIRDPILGGVVQISGLFTSQQANDMALLMRSGELPGKLTLLEQR
jgi:protein-export membrane protein SecD